MKTWLEKLPKFKPSKGKEPKGGVIAEGVIDVEKRYHEDKAQLFSIFDYVGGFTREKGFTNISVLDSTMAHLNGCKVRITLEILEFPLQSSGERRHLRL